MADEEYKKAMTDSDEYYNNLKEEKYRAMLDSEIQLANAKQNALKATNTNMAALGMDGSGYGVIAGSGTQNSYLNAMKGAQAAYNEEVNKVNEAQRQEQITKESAAANDLNNLFAGAGSEAELTKSLNDYGIEIDEEGNFTGDYWNGLSEDTKRTILSRYNMYKSQLQSSDYLAGNTVDGQAYKDSGVAIQELSDSNGNKGTTKNEIRYIFSDDYMKGRRNGDVVKLVNGGDNNAYVYMLYYNGAWYKTTGEVFNKTKESGGNNSADVIKGK